MSRDLHVSCPLLVSLILPCMSDPRSHDGRVLDIYEGGDLKITPRTEATGFQDYLGWITDWIPSAMPSSLKWWEVIVHGIPQGDSADQNQIWMLEQNGRALQNCLLGASHWIGKGNLPGRKAALRIKIGDAEKANDLITNGVFLNYNHHRVSR